MGNIPEKESGASSSLNRSHSSPARHTRSSSTHDRRRGQKSPDSPRPPSRQNRNSLRRQVLRNANGRASNPNLSFNQNSSTNGAKNPFLTNNQRDFIQGNWDSQKRYDLCRRIYLRAFGKRPDIRSIFEMSGDGHLWHSEVEAFADFLQLIMISLDDFSIVRTLALDFGRRHGEWRRYGFKSEFWVTLAEAMTKECVYLDAAVHPPDEVLEAWSKLVGFIFGWIRDGYYESLRLQRQLSRRVTQSLSPNALVRLSPAKQRTYSLEGEGAMASHSRKVQSPVCARRATMCASSATNDRRVRTVVENG